MHLTAVIRYDGVDPETVFGMLTDPVFQERKCAATGAIEHDVDVEQFDDGSATVTTRRTMPTDRVPDLVKAFVGATVRVDQSDDWAPAAQDGQREGSIVVQIPGTPVRLTGTLRLVAEDGGTVQYVDGDLQASVPLIGGKIERATEPAVRAAIDAEQEVGRAWLSKAN